MLPSAVAAGSNRTDGKVAAGEACAGAPTKRRIRKRPQPSQLHLTVPVAFNRYPLGSGDAAFVLAEMLQHTLFMRGQLPMPYHQLLKVLNKREECDAMTREEKAAAAAAATAAAAAAAQARASGDAGAGRGAGEGAGGGGGGTGSGGPRGAAATPVIRRSRGTRAKSGRPLAKTCAHRRARKCVEVLEKTTAAIEEAFSDAARKGRPVLEALVLLGASHLSPREIYSVTFSEPSPDGSLPGESDGGGCGVQGKSSLAEAYSRKLVRSMVGEMSGISFRGLGSCRVHLFLRVADAPLSVARNTDSATGNSNGSSGTKTPDNDGANTARYPLPAAPAQPPVQSPISLAGTTALRHLVPRPGFKIRVSRSRPAPKVSIMLSERPSAPPSIPDQPPAGAVGACSGEWRGEQDERNWRRRQLTAADNGNFVRGGVEGEGSKQRGVWYQLVCARLVGLKGCDSLAG